MKKSRLDADGFADYMASRKYCFGKSSPSPPPAPDYSGAAVATAAGNRENSIAAQRGSMVNQFTPYGDLTYSLGGKDENNNPYYNATYSLNDAGNTLLNQQNKLSEGLFNAQNSAGNQVNAQGPLDTGGVQGIADQAYSNYTKRLDPQWDAASKALDNKLANQGIMQGSEAYNNEHRTFDAGKNDAYTQANTASLGMMPQTYQLAEAQYNQPLNRLNALRTGSQVTNPTFSAQPAQQYTPGPDLLGAAQGQNQYNMGLYNSQVGKQNSAMNGLFGLGSAGITAFL